jgi:hypothetical protein
MHSDSLPPTPLEVVFWYWVYASVPAALLASALVYRFFGGDRYPIRCLWAISVPWCTMPCVLLLLSIESFRRTGFAGLWWLALVPLIVPFLLLLSGHIGLLGKNWGLKWRVAFGLSLIGETILAVLMTGASGL